MPSIVEKIRLVALGAAKVGKTALVKRLLFNTFDEKYKPTVEQLYTKECRVCKCPLKVDILDTAGDLQFPAVRKLSIATSHAFLLVYAVDNASSFDTLKHCINEIQEQRQDYCQVPIVIVGNKTDLDARNVVVKFNDVADWVNQTFSDMRLTIMECSAKENANVQQVFRSYLVLSKLFAWMPETSFECDSKKKENSRRRCISAHGCSSHSLGGLMTLFKKPAGSTSSSPSPETDAKAISRNKLPSENLIKRCSIKIRKGEETTTEGLGECQMM